MKKEVLREIDSRITLCLDAEKKLDYINSLLNSKKIGKLEHDILKAKILGNKFEHEAREEINEYIEKAINLKNKLKTNDRITAVGKSSVIFISLILLFLGTFLFVLNPAFTGFVVLSDLDGTFLEGFETNSLDTNDWTLTGCWVTSETPIYGLYSVYCSSADSVVYYLRNNVSTLGYRNINLTFWATTNDNTNEIVTAQWYDGTTWSTLATIDTTVTEEKYFYNIPAGANNNPKFAIRFSSAGSNVLDEAYLDNVTVTGNINHLPNISRILLNSTHATNFVTENLTVYWNSTDKDGDRISNITDWRLNGTSMALMNLAFERNGTRNATDYSTYRRKTDVIKMEGTAYPIWNATGGFKGGGAYQFGGSATNNKVNAVNSTLVTKAVKNVSIEARFKTTDYTTRGQAIVYIGSDASTNGYGLFINNEGETTGRVDFLIGGIAWYYTGKDIQNSNWHHIVGILKTDGRVQVYLDGVSIYNSTTSSVATTPTKWVTIGDQDYTVSYRGFKGFIDNVRIYNRTLTKKEVALLNLSDSTLSFAELKIGQNWTACITPNDGLGNGITRCSNNVTILQVDYTAPVISKINHSAITGTTALINWTTNEPANSSVRYGKTLSLGSSTGSSSYVKNHSILLSTLSKTTLYYYNVSSCDVARNCKVNGTFSFTTKSTGNDAPVISNLYIESFLGTNTTHENLTGHWTATDADDNKVINITDWRVDSVSIALLNMPFENHSNSKNNATDYSTNQNNGSVTGAKIVNGKIGKAYLFNGSNNIIRFRNITVSNSSSTVTFWIRPNAYSTAYQAIFTQYDGNRGFFDWGDRLSYLDDAGNHYPLYLSKNTWYHVAAVFYAENLTFYINGTKRATYTEIQGFKAGSIGNDFWNDKFNGTIDELRVYNRSLSANQIRALYQNKTYLIVPNETVQGDQWRLAVTPNDGLVDGITVFSNNITIIPPGIYNVTSTNVTNSTVRINWGTIARSNSTLKYGTTLSLGAKETDANYVNFRTIIPTKLLKTTLYYFNVTSCGRYSDCQTNGTFSFTTKTNPPSVSNVFLNSTYETNFTTENLTIHWTSVNDGPQETINITDWRINGTSIAIINMPFENHTVADYSLNDYSTYNNKGVLRGATLTQGYFGTGYRFNVNTNITIPNSQSIELSGNFTIEHWIYRMSDLPSWENLFFLQNGTHWDYGTYLNIDTNYFFFESSDLTPAGYISDYAPPLNKWVHLAAVYKEGESVDLYANGRLNKSVPIVSGTISYAYTAAAKPFGVIGMGLNGTIDGLRVYNRALSPEQIWQLYRNRTDLIVSNETNPGENWTACITPNDIEFDGATVCSNIVKIRSVIPVISQLNKSGITTTTAVINWTTNLASNTTVRYGTAVSLASKRAIQNSVTAHNVTLLSLTAGTLYYFNVSSCANNYCKTNGTFSFTTGTSGANSLPVVSNVILNSTHGTNLTTENLTVYWVSTDANGDRIANITDWRMNRTSISIFHYEFEKNTSSTTAGAIRDYSTNKRNATLGSGAGTPVWTMNSIAGGGYKFNLAGIDDRIDSVSTLNIAAGDSFSVEILAYSNTNIQNDKYFLDRTTSANSVIDIHTEGDDDIQFRIRGTNVVGLTSTTAINVLPNKDYVHIVGIRNVSGDNIAIYINGVRKDSDTDGTTAGFSHVPRIGNHATNILGFNGTIFYARWYNRSLSPQQILILNATKFKAMNKISDKETKVGENWTACITPNDKIGDGTTVCSNNLTITTAAGDVTISHVNKSGITNAGAVINWTTNLASNTTVRYGKTVSLGTKRAIQNSVTAHNVTLFSLVANTLYYFNVSSCAGTYCKTNGTFSFTTRSNMSISAINKSGITNTGAVINWTTNLAGNTSVWYKYPTGTLTKRAIQNSVTAHNVTLLSLRAGTTYKFNVSSCTGTNCKTNVSSYSFTTKPNLTISQLNKSGITTTTAVINWTTNLASNTTVRYGTAVSLGTKRAIQNSVTAHNVTLLSLASGTLYYFNVSSCTGTNCKTNGTFSFTTRTSGANSLPVVSNVILNSTHGTNLTTENLTVYWTSTDANGDRIFNITNWKINRTSMSLLNLHFERNGTKNMTDYSGYGNKPTSITGAVWFSNKGHLGSGVYNFTGSGGIIIGNSAGGNPTIPLGSRSRTITAWVNYNYSSNYLGDIITAGTGTSNCNTFSLGIDTTTNRLIFWGQSCDFSSTLVVPKRTWTFIAATYNGTNLTLYVNDNSQTTSKALNTASSKVYIGEGSDGSSIVSHLKGFIDEVKIYNRSLSREQIIEIYRNRTDLIVSQETKVSENWTACITPNDGNADGLTKCSNNLTITTAAGDVTISHVNKSGITNSGAVINWTTNLASNTTVRYGKTVSLGTKRAIQNSVTAHNVTLFSLTAGTLYYFNVSSCAGTYCKTNGTFSFTTKPNMSISAINKSGITNTGAVINWTTNLAGNTSVWYKYPTGTLTKRAIQNSVTAHNVTLLSLRAGTTYKFNVSSCTGTNCKTNVSSYSFTTKPNLTISQLNKSGITTTTAVINWTTNLASNTTVKYGTTVSITNTRAIQNSVTAHNVTLFSLVANTLYYFNVSSCTGTNCKTNGTFSFTTRSVANTLPVVSNVILNSTHRTNYTTDNLTVYWTSTDANGDKVINITDWRINGRSIAVLNMPFERNGTKNATDYSTFRNTVSTISGNVLWNKTGGYNGAGAYDFDGINDYMLVNDDSSLNITGSMAISFRIYNKGGWVAGDGILEKRTANSETPFSVLAASATGIMSNYYNGAAWSTSVVITGVNQNTWTHITIVRNLATARLLGYKNGVLVSNVSTIGPAVGINQKLRIGLGGWGATYYINATLDDLRIYNRTLSLNEIKLLNLPIDRVMHSDETIKNQNWTSCITPNDGNADGLTKCSNNVTIRNSIPTAPTLIAPNNGNDTNTNLTVYFNWTDSTDQDGDTLTYSLNLTSLLCADQTFELIPDSNFTSPELSVVTECGYYNWTIRAFDGYDYSVYSEIFNFSIQPYVAIRFTANLSDFGHMLPNEINDTTDENPPSFVIVSDSNVEANITIRGLDDLWVTEGLGNDSFRYKVNETAETNSFDFINSQRLFRNVTFSSTRAIKQLKYSSIEDSAKIELEVTVPATETPGQRSSNLILEAVQAG